MSFLFKKPATMTYNSKYALSATAKLPGVAFSAIRSVSLYEAQEHDLPVLIDQEDELVIDTEYGAYQFVATDEETMVTIHSDAETSVFILKDALIQNLDHFIPGTADSITWSDNQITGKYPPNFQFTTVQSVKAIGSCFIRVRLLVPQLSEFTDTAIHFRLVLPLLGIENVEWPTVRENGSTRWPTGEKTLHKPVYTVRQIDRNNQTFDFDVFVHEGGYVTQWAKQLKTGDQVAILGPGGGGIPETNKIHVFADETAYPAAARILETLPSDTTGSLTLLADDSHTDRYAFTVPSGVKVTWVTRSEMAAFQALAGEAITNLQNAYFWYAGERSHVMAIRELAVKNDVKKEARYIAAYWSAN